MLYTNTLYRSVLNSARNAIVPSRGVELFSDFVADWSPFSICTGTTALAGASSFNIGSGMNAAGKAYGELQMTLTAYATSPTRIGVYANGVGGTANLSTTQVNRDHRFVDCPYDFEARVCVTNFPGTLQRLGVGFFNSHAPASPTNFVQNGAAFVSTNSGNWKCVVASADVQVETNTSFSSSVYRRLRITTDPNTNVIQFFIDDQAVLTTSASWDTVNSYLSWCVEARDKTSVAVGGNGTFLVDYMSLIGTYNR